MLVLAVAKYLDKLLKNRGMAAITSLGKLSRVVEMTVDLAVMFVVAVRGTEDRRAHRAGEVVDMVFAVQGCDVGRAQGLSALVAEEAQPPEVVSFAKGVLALAIFVIDREKLGRDNLPAIL
jgi:hypothetical protein